jgi:uncharacterized protein (TIGR02588 family)
MMAPRQDKGPREPLLEWIAAGLGLVLTLGVLGVIGREAIAGDAEEPPAIEVRAVSVRPLASGFRVEVVAANRAGGTGAAVAIEGELMSGETSVETSDFTFDYVPGHAERRGGLFFKEDPRKHRLELRALGYQQP